MKTALLVVDVQQSFMHRPYWRDADLPAFLSNLQTLVDRCEAHGVPALQVFHQEEDAGPGNPFSSQSGYVKAMPQLRIKPEAVFFKSVHSALFACTADGVPLEQWLRQKGIDHVIVTGIRTEQCCETTARHASDSLISPAPAVSSKVGIMSRLSGFHINFSMAV